MHLPPKLKTTVITFDITALFNAVIEQECEALSSSAYPPKSHLSMYELACQRIYEYSQKEIHEPEKATELDKLLHDAFSSIAPKALWPSLSTKVLSDTRSGDHLLEITIDHCKKG
jgi:hypothetical protein